VEYRGAILRVSRVEKVRTAKVNYTDYDKKETPVLKLIVSMNLQSLKCCLRAALKTVSKETRWI
jgi:hypothetical protein